ncbi:hypothetical protein H257_18308 [Aphanomyces astaci]|uniref:Uncharacterized protein n=1 Tax=Aphanomyces astaci TaxID=112090 RepID=W4FBK9_APHAT|nr:hypothetical protein H257_18308 [Aphanomyces astaci]ETV64880.1 hypothetical protein H257_18308 [Aphanomyces astaci]|eukprot:XP_009845646.1 hypothetical protein H257_18308 [Aphanomyces astaci]
MMASDDDGMNNWWLCMGISLLVYVDVQVNAVLRPYPALFIVTPITCIVLMVMGHLLARFPRRRACFAMSVMCMMAVVLVVHTVVHASFRYSLMQSCCNRRWSTKQQPHQATFNPMSCAMTMLDCSYSILAGVLHLGSLFLCLHGMVRASVFHVEMSIHHFHLQAAFDTYMDRLCYVHYICVIVPHRSTTLDEATL